MNLDTSCTNGNKNEYGTLYNNLAYLFIVLNRLLTRDVNKATEYKAKARTFKAKAKAAVFKAKAKVNVGLLLLLLHTSHYTTILNPIYVCKLVSTRYPLRAQEIK